MGGFCKVLGCKNHERRSGLHFFKFPKNIKRKIWIQFTKRPADFDPKPSAAICLQHFEDKYIIEKNNKFHLTKDAVPTIYLEDTDEGVKETVISFDGNFEAFEDDPENIEDDPEYVTVKKQLPDLKTICRFCAEAKETVVEMKYFQSYNIDIFKFMENVLELSLQTNDKLSDFVCEDCFNQIVSIDAFKVKCKNAETKILAELETAVLNINPELRVVEPNLDQNQMTEIEIINPSLDEESEEDYNDNDDAEYVIEDEYTDNNDGLISFEHQVESNVEIVAEEEQFDSYDQIQNISQEEFSQHMQSIAEVEQESLPNTGDYVKDINGTKTILRVYECIFCKKKFGGRKTYRAHVCSIKEIKCGETNCNKIFNNGKNYRAHVARAHRHSRFEKFYCPICRAVIFGNATKFHQHRKKCNQERKGPIECEICKKVLPTLNGYTIHKLFHTSKKLELNKKKAVKTNTESKGKLCEMCGKNFMTSTGHRIHLMTVHNESDEIFDCSICQKTCANKPALNDHIRNTHKVQESPCVICKKVFRTKVLLRKHMIYHDESKRIFKCSQCPDKPGFFTNVSLRRHQKSHNNERPYNCEVCGSSYGTNWQLKQHMSKHPNYKNQVTVKLQDQ